MEEPQGTGPEGGKRVEQSGSRTGSTAAGAERLLTGEEEEEEDAEVAGAIRDGSPGRTTLRRLRMVALPVFLLAAQVLVACGGGGEPAAQGSPEP